MELAFDVIHNEKPSFGASFIGFKLALLNEITTFYGHILSILSQFRNKTKYCTNQYLIKGKVSNILNACGIKLMIFKGT